MEKVLFTEEQRSRKWWLWIFFTAAILSVLIPMGIETKQGESFGVEPLNDIEPSLPGILFTVVMIGVMVIFMISRLKTKITTKAVWVSFWPIMRKWKKISAEEIGSYEIRTFRPKREYGGHGIKRRRRAGSAYTIAGNLGLQLHLKDDKKILIGTQKKQAIEYAMRKLMEGEE
ncbi:hypothetical protein [Maribellus mangrovi]|uniref:hypothetical protein n=1 Tax=Maribellus mangrovi TaxID=3133146 RepID=UPI0030EC62D4